MTLWILCTITALAWCVSTFEEDAFWPDRAKRLSFVSDSEKNYSLVEDLDVKAKLFKQYITKTGYKIGIYNDILMGTHVRMLQGLATYKLGSWTYRIHETDVLGKQRHTSLNNIPWYNDINAVEFSESIVSKQLQKVVMDMVGEEKGVYVPYNVVGHIVRTGDSPKVHVDAKPQEDEVSMLVYLNKKWRKNDYGDLYLYDDNKEIIAGVVPRCGRIVVWQSPIPYLPRPPSVAVKHGQLFLHIRFTKNQTKFMNAHEKWLEDEKQQETIQNEGFFLKLDADENLQKPTNVKTKLISKAKSSQHKQIFVFDDLFTKDVLDHLRSVILNHGVYYYDDSYEVESDNVQWIAGFDVDSYVQSRMWGITRDVAKYVSGGHRDWFPYDVSCNLIRNADATQIHRDCSEAEDEWTFLLYLNPDWRVDDYGETVFYEKNDDDTEIITEVLPKYGRIVIFQGIIPHSARPPSRNFTGARLSFAVKLSTNEWTGRIKAAQEELRHFTGALAMLHIIKHQFLDGNDGDRQETDPTDLEEDFEPTLDDNKLQEMQDELDRLTNNGGDIEEARVFLKETKTSHLETREQIGVLIRQML